MTTKQKWKDANGPCDDALREEVLAAFELVENWSASRGKLLARSGGWWILVERVEDGLVSFLARKGDDRRTFWMNRSSVSHLRPIVERQAGRRWTWPGDEKALAFVSGGDR